MSNTLKKREPNFAHSETELLTSLVKRYSNVLENKKTDLVNNQLKEETWIKLAEDFNSASGLYERNAKTLRAKYENLKKSLKRKYGEHRRSLYGTGGGPPQDLNLTQEEEIIMELAGPSVEGLPARYDCDEIIEVKETIVAPESQVIAELEIPRTVRDNNNIDANAIKVVKPKNKTEDLENTPNRFLFKRKRATPLVYRNPEVFNNTMENYSELTRKKQELIAAQIRNIEEKTIQEKREHELRCELLALDILLKNKQLNK